MIFYIDVCFVFVVAKSFAADHKSGEAGSSLSAGMNDRKISEESKAQFSNIAYRQSDSDEKKLVAST
jgi:hypothetical protein